MNEEPGILELVIDFIFLLGALLVLGLLFGVKP